MKLYPEDDECMDERENRNKPVFTHCNVCGRGLVRADELAVGMCAICANEEMPEE